MKAIASTLDGLAVPARRAAAALFVLVFAVVALPAQGMARAAPESFADLADKLLPAVVNVATTQTVKRSERPEIPQLPPGSPFEEFFRHFFDQMPQNAPSRKLTSLGSGFIIDPSGLIVTNNHVIEDADEITINFHDKSSAKATVIGRDPRTDLALLKVDTGKALAYVKWGTSADARVGDWVLAIGNPFNLGGTVTAGIVSAHHRDINAGPYDDFIQTDASINRGNSGGPLFNLDGEVVGINTAIYSPSGGSIGIGFAIPADRARVVIAQLRENGKISRGWLGVRIQSVTDEIAQGLGLDKATGALIASVADNGPAKKAGIQAGDVVVQFNGKDITEMRRLPWSVAETPVGETVPVVVVRNGKKMTFSVKLGELPEEEQLASAEQGGDGATPGTASVLGLELSPLTPELRKRYTIPDSVKGVVVTAVEPNSAAAEKGIRPGQLVVKVGQGQKQVSRPSDVESEVKSAREAKQKTILLLVESNGNQRFVALRLG